MEVKEISDVDVMIALLNARDLNFNMVIDDPHLAECAVDVAIFEKLACEFEDAHQIDVELLKQHRPWRPARTVQQVLEDARKETPAVYRRVHIPPSIAKMPTEERERAFAIIDELLPASTPTIVSALRNAGIEITRSRNYYACVIRFLKSYPGRYTMIGQRSRARWTKTENNP